MTNNDGAFERAAEVGDVIAKWVDQHSPNESFEEWAARNHIPKPLADAAACFIEGVGGELLDKNRVARLRRVARKRELYLFKSRCRTRLDPSYGRYFIHDLRDRVVLANATLDEVEKYLTGTVRGY